MRIVVTGGCGFVGSHVVDRLLAMGHEPIVIDNLSGTGRYGASGVAPYCITLGLTEHTDALTRVMKNADAVIHCAAYADLRSNWETTMHRSRLLYDNVHGTIHLLETMPIIPLAMTSTASIFGAQHVEYARTEFESGVETIESPYAASKLAAEGYIAAYAHARNFPWYCARLVNVVGSRTAHGVIGDFVRKARDGHIHAADSGVQRKSWVHVRDVADALIRMVTGRLFPDVVGSGMPSGVYTVTSTERISWWDIIDAMGWPREKVTPGLCDRGAIGDPHDLFLSGAKLAPFYVPHRLVRDGIREALAHLGWTVPS